MARTSVDSPRKSGGGKLNRNQTVTVRLDERLRYLAELAARHQRRTLSSFIEWAIEEALDKVDLGIDPSDESRVTLATAGWALWDVDEADRMVKLATQEPTLLNYEEQILWKLIKETPGLWIKERTNSLGNRVYLFNDLDKDKLREHWADLQKAASGDLDKGAVQELIDKIDIPF